MGKRASIDRPAIGYREHTHLAADGGNRADRCDNGPPGRALPPCPCSGQKNRAWLLRVAFIAAGIALMTAVG